MYLTQHQELGQKEVIPRLSLPRAGEQHVGTVSGATSVGTLEPVLVGLGRAVFLGRIWSILLLVQALPDVESHEEFV